MKFWHFHFEGRFSPESAEYPRQGVFSSCLVREDEYVDAEFAFLQALSKVKINLIEIAESFIVDTDPEEMDPTNPENTFWFEWCEETVEAGEPTFEQFCLYPEAEVLVINRGN